MKSDFFLNKKGFGIYSGVIISGVIKKITDKLIEIEVEKDKHIVIPKECMFHTFEEALTAFQSKDKKEIQIETFEDLLRFAIENDLISKKKKKLYKQFVEASIKLGLLSPRE